MAKAHEEVYVVNPEVVDWKVRERLYIDTLEAQKRYFEAYQCVVCGKAGHLITFPGGRTEVLCLEHIDEIRSYVTEHYTWRQWIEVVAAYDAAVHSGKEGLAITAKRRKEEVVKKLYDLQGEWLEVKKEDELAAVFQQRPKFAQGYGEGEDQDV